MPALTRWFIKSALVYLVIALFLAVVLVVPAFIRTFPFLAYLNPAYFHLFLVGWVTQMIFGVIYWMFPIITRANPRGNEKLGWASYGLLNMGLICRVVGEPLVGIYSQTPIGWLLVVSALSQWLAAILFVILAWPRVKEKYRGG